MKKTVKEYVNKTIKVLEKESHDLQKEIALMVLNVKSNPQKDTNLLVKKRKKLAVLLTVLHTKQLELKTEKKIK